MPADVDEVEKELDSFYTDVSEERLFEYMEDKIRESDANNLQRAQFLVAYRNYDSIEKVLEKTDNIETWMKWGATAMISITSITVSVVLASAL